MFQEREMLAIHRVNSQLPLEIDIE